MKKIILFALLATAFIATTQAQTRRNRVDYLDVRLKPDPTTQLGAGILFYDNTDSTFKVKNPNGSVTVLSYSGNDTIWTQSGTDIFLTDSTNNVGVGFSSPTEKLEVLGNIKCDTVKVPAITDATNVISIAVDTVSVQGLILGGNGTAADPTYSFTNSTGVGIYRSASNVLGIATAGTERMTVDAQGDLNIAGGRGVNSVADADMWATFVPSDAQQALTDTGAANVTAYYTALTTTVAAPVTLAAGTQIGQLKKIGLVVDGGADATLTLTGYTSIVFNDAGDYVILLWKGAAWFAIENNGTTITP